MNFSAFIEGMDLFPLHEDLSEKERSEMARMDEEFPVLREVPDEDLLNHLCSADRHALDLVRWDFERSESRYTPLTTENAHRAMLRLVILMREALDATD